MKPEEFDLNSSPEKWGSFLPLLMAILVATDGPVLEIGIGHYSTPKLHIFCAPTGRELTSVESDYDWFVPFAAKYGSASHRFIYGEYDTLVPRLAQKKWSVVFLDNSPGDRRGQDIVTLLDSADFIVIHDHHIEMIPKLEGLQYHVSNFQLPATIVVSRTKEIPYTALKT